MDIFLVNETILTTITITVVTHSEFEVRFMIILTNFNTNMYIQYIQILQIMFIDPLISFTNSLGKQIKFIVKVTAPVDVYHCYHTNRIPGTPFLCLDI